jgi:hypothetical protein
MAESGVVEDAIRDLLERTRNANLQYASAHYHAEDAPAGTGLGARLDAIEQALVLIARAMDER